MQTYFNGQFIEPTDARVALTDAGYQHAVGLFESMQVYHGRVFQLERHLERLANSCTSLGLARTLDTDALAAAVNQTIEHNQIDRARLRLTLSGGDTNLTKPEKDNRPGLPTVAITCEEPTIYDPAYFEKGITVLMTPPLANPFDPMQGHKTFNYWGRLRTLRQAATAGAGEAIWLNISNHLASGAVSNLFIVSKGKLLTPIARGEEAKGALGAPVLPGTTRAAVIDLAESLDIPVERKMLGISDLLDADEAFLTNTGWLILPIASVETKVLRSKGIGTITAQLRTALLEHIETSTAS